MTGNETHSDLRLNCSLQHYALFLDVDGTLLPITTRHYEVRVPAALISLLQSLREELRGALALISGRAIADLDDLFAPLVLPAAGIHGLERRRYDDDYYRNENTNLLEPLRHPLEAFVRERHGLLLEDKGLSLALHYRMAPEREVEVLRHLNHMIDRTQSKLEVKRGKMVFEVKPKGGDKGTAIDAFMNEQPFKGRKPIFLGDDVTDEDGFATVNRLDGISVKVGATESTLASQCLPDEAAVHAWLEYLAKMESRYSKP
ncbi:trehalose-phosphatase [Pelagibius litoralis]|uniref:Trehalose 6-phosphate phosphatase n=1 Tax=Pelagibius litoralis TaxID=374515 RepID=A0A967EZF2_9PROT|nr:trehalose-phosphatase [Pelagibius litoralis]NIA70236.1 trehalose-phosphatase [Pelagibius litoralis]